MYSHISRTNVSDSVNIICHTNGNNATEANRIKTRINSFQRWTGVKTPTQLAIAGFRYTGTSDKVVCETCGLRLFNWREHDNAIHIHKQYSPNCSFIKKWFGGQETVSDHSNSLIPPPSYPHYSTYQQRVDSFIGWPLKYEHQSPSCMARNGFFYIGSADRVACFQCGLRLRDWDDDDYPSECHKEWSSNCPFINQNESHDISNTVQDAHEYPQQSSEDYMTVEAMSTPNNLNYSSSGGSTDAQATPEVKVNNCTASPPDACHNTTSFGSTDAQATPEVKVNNCTASPPDACHNTTSFGSTDAQAAPEVKVSNYTADTTDVQTIPESTSHASNTNDACLVNWSSPKVQAVLEMGCDKKLIERVTTEHLRSSGTDFPSAVQLYDAILEIECIIT